MNETKINHQLCYFAKHNAQGEAMNLLSFGFRQLQDTYIYKNQSDLKSLCESLNEKINPIVVNNQIIGFASNQLIDSIKIHICYENYLKGALLASGIIIHKLNKDTFPDLAKKQQNEPVERNEVVKISEWIENPQIILPKPLRLQIKGIQKNTLGTNILTKKKYLDRINFNENILKILKPYFEYRNNLHYYTGEYFSLNKELYSNFRNLIIYSNQNIVTIHNQLVDNLKKIDSYKLKEI